MSFTIGFLKVNLISHDHDKVRRFLFFNRVHAYRLVFGLPAAIRLLTDRMVTNSSAAEGCIPTCTKDQLMYQ